MSYLTCPENWPISSKIIETNSRAELEHPDQCCGGAGIYNITQYDLSMRILDRKIEDIKNSNTEIVATGNPGCILQIGYGLRKAGVSRIRVMHPVELLDQAYQTSRKLDSEG